MSAVLLLFVPISLAAAVLISKTSLWTFAAAIAAIVPIADWIRRATDHLARRAGPALGGLLSVSFGNVAEFVLALFVLVAGKTDVVKAQITGSIIGNGLLGLGLAIVVGSIGRDKQTFSRARAGQLSSMLVLSTVALLLPALFDRAVGAAPGAMRRIRDEHLSLAVSIVLIATYAANLLYTLVTHRDAFAFAHDDELRERRAMWPIWQAVAVLIAGTALTASEADLIAGALEPVASRLGVTQFFIGVILLAVTGNAAEYASAAYFARENRIGLAMSITVGSTIQIALLVAPLLVIASAVLGRPMDLVFSSPLELIAIVAVTFGVNAIAQDGETTWFEGVLLLSLYALLGLAFYFV
jgi:Ca2+:H+ antiporter